jgi:NAD(P)-dependent dehydrogenase (short-subunit alcohol dehydrogenase family)
MIFSGQTVAITGAAGGVGQALCRVFAGEGAKIAALDISPQLQGFIADLRAEGVIAEGERADIGDSTEIAKAFAALRARLGDIDVLINNAGYSRHPTFAKTDPIGWRDDVNGNLNGAYHCAHAVLPAMVHRKRGVIVNVGSVNGLMALGDPAYSAAKAGMISLTRSLALEYGRYNVRVNAVLPGTVRTPIWN